MTTEEGSMKKQWQQQQGVASQGIAWIRSMAGVPAALVSTQAQGPEQEWLGWDGWVSVSAAARP